MLIHVVQTGDTVYALARRYGLTPRRIQEDNGLLSGQSLVVGQALVIAQEGDWQKRGTLSVLGFAYPHIRRDTLRAALPALTYLGIFSYGFEENGELIVPQDEELIREAYAQRVAPLLVLTSITQDGNFSTQLTSRLLNSPQLQQTVLDNLLAVMGEKGYLGVDLDFEYIAAEDRMAYADFASRAAERMREAGYSLSVDLAPKTSAQQSGLLYEGHDYALLGAAADRVMLMTYEWGYTYGPPMAVAPVDQVRQVLRYAVTEIEPTKILLGLPNYGYDWTLPFVQGTSRAENLGNEGAVRLAAERGAAIEFDERSQSPFFHYWRDGQEHEVWFEDARSVRAKLDLVEEFGLRGVGWWNIMRPFRPGWTWLTGNYDVRKVVS